MLLIVFGIVALAVGGISYTKREKVIDLGPIQATADRQKTIPLSPIAGIASLAVGGVLVASGRAVAGPTRVIGVGSRALRCEARCGSARGCGDPAASDNP